MTARPCREQLTSFGVTDTTRLGLTGSDKTWVYALSVGGGFLLGLLAPWLADLLREVPFVPFKPALEWIGDVTQWWAWIARPAGGLALGLLAALVIIDEEYILEISDDEIIVLRGDNRRHLPKAKVVGVHRDGKRIIIDGEHGRVLFDKSVEASRDKVAQAFTAHGYPWEG